MAGYAAVVQLRPRSLGDRSLRSGARWSTLSWSRQRWERPNAFASASKAPFPSRLLITPVAKTGHKNEISPQTRTHPQFCKERGLFTERGKELGSLAISMVYHEDRGGMVLTVNPGT